MAFQNIVAEHSACRTFINHLRRIATATAAGAIVTVTVVLMYLPSRPITDTPREQQTQTHTHPISYHTTQQPDPTQYIQQRLLA
jgi:hypothetical protein